MTRGKVGVDQLNGWCGAPHTFCLASLSFEYLARQKCIFSFGGDCTGSVPSEAFPIDVTICYYRDLSVTFELSI